MLEDDPAERYSETVEAASGERPHGCPWRQLQDPFVRWVTRAHRWFKTGELEARFGGRVPHALLCGIETYDAAVNAIGGHDRRVDRERAEQKRREEELMRSARAGNRPPLITGARRTR